LTEGERTEGEPETARRRGPLLIGLAIFLFGALAGWYVNVWIDGPGDVSVNVDRPIEIVETEAVAEGTMPNLLGLDEKSARAALLDAGADPASIEVSQASYAGDPDLVIDQEPPVGTELDGSVVSVVVSEQGPMPDLEGLTADEARDQVTQLGARATIVSTFVPGVDPDVVVGSFPAPGDPLRSVIELSVSEPESSVYLNQVRAASSDCTGRPAVVGGVSYDDALQCRARGDGSANAVYTLREGVTRFETTVGALDSSGATAEPLTFRVYLDGEQAAAETLSFGESVPIAIDTDGAVQLRLEFEAADGSDELGSPIVGVFAEPSVIGARTAIDEMER
jgi:hypothetical protein